MEDASYEEKASEVFDKLTPQDIATKRTLVATDKLYRPKLHLCPPFGLLNDPNGLAYFNDYYYIFYQWHPNATKHGMKHWGLYKTKDFINYKDVGLFLAPHHLYDNFGIYSGGACVIGEELHLFYTGNHRDPLQNYARLPHQWHLVVDKHDHIVLREELIDFNASYTEHQRDPYPFFREGKLHLLLGAQSLEKVGKLLLYTLSDRASHVEGCQEVLLPKELDEAFMLECPTLMCDGETNILILSPQGLAAKDKYSYNNIYSVVYMRSGSMDFSHSAVQSIDSGFDFYAPQIFHDGKRSLMIGWLGQADTIYPHEVEYGWSQVLTMPRELSYKQGRLCALPIAELQMLRYAPRAWYSGIDCSTRQLDFALQVEQTFKIKLGNEKYFIEIGARAGDYYIDRSQMQLAVNEQYGSVRYGKQHSTDARELRIIVDNSCMEVFFGAGACVMSLRFFIDNLAFAVGEGIVGGEVYALRPITLEAVRE
jgi:beta-fructofuranosidase